MKVEVVQKCYYRIMAVNIGHIMEHVIKRSRNGMQEATKHDNDIEITAYTKASHLSADNNQNDKILTNNASL